MHSLNRISLALALTFAAAFPVAAATTIKIATVAPDGTAWMREMRAAGDAVKKGTDGRVEIKYYPGGVMGDDATVMRKIKIGQLQGSAFTGGEATVITPDAQVYSIPFLFRDQQEIDKLRAKLDPLVKQQFENAGFELLGISGAGFAYLMSTRDIKSRDDLKSAKVWVPQGDKAAEVTFKVAGVTPIPYVVGEIVVDKKVIDTLSAEDRKVLGDAFDAGFARLEKTSREDNASAREALKQQGIAFTVPTDADRKSWEAVGTEAFKQLADQGGISPTMLKALNTALAEIRGGAK